MGYPPEDANKKGGEGTTFDRGEIREDATESRVVPGQL
jgi:hypothetical protein